MVKQRICVHVSGLPGQDLLQLKFAQSFIQHQANTGADVLKLIKGDINAALKQPNNHATCKPAQHPPQLLGSP
jgi:hypothetical protein